MHAEDSIKNNIYYSSGIKLPEQDNYETAYNEAVSELHKRDLKDIALKSGAQIINDHSSVNLIIPFIRDEILISYPQISLNYKNKDAELSLWYKILLLHYLIQAKGTPAAGEQITFKQITGGLAYYPAFHRRTIKPVINKFKNNFNNFISAAEKIGGTRFSACNYSVFFPAFPKISIIFNIWEGDEELPADGNVVFDSSITDYLTTEDIAVLCNIIALKLCKEDL